MKKLKWDNGSEWPGRSESYCSQTKENFQNAWNLLKIGMESNFDMGNSTRTLFFDNDDLLINYS